MNYFHRTIEISIETRLAACDGLRRIPFERFYRANKSRTRASFGSRAGGGAGWGLRLQSSGLRRTAAKFKSRANGDAARFFLFTLPTPRA